MPLTQEAQARNEKRVLIAKWREEADWLDRQITYDDNFDYDTWYAKAEVYRECADELEASALAP